MTGKFVKAAIRHYPSTLGHRILAATDYYTAQRIVDEFSEVTGHKAEVAQISAEAFKAFFPEQMAEEMYENMMLLVDPGYYGGQSLGPSLALLDERPTGWREFVERNKAMW